MPAVAALALLATGAPVLAQSKCTGAKIKAAGKKAQCKAGVEAKADAKNLTADTAKLAGCEEKFSAAFTKAEANTKSPCIAPNGDAGAIEGKVDAFVNDVQNTEATGNLGTDGSKCVSAKVKAAGKKASCKLGIYSKAAVKASPLDTAKLAGCETKFSAASMKADGGSDCGSAHGDAAAIEAKVDAFVADVNGELTTGTTTTTTAATTTTTNPHTCGNGTIEGPFETCDDGNMTDESLTHTLPPDSCPKNCRIEPCTSTSGTVSVSVNFSSSAQIAGYTVFVDYPEGKVVIPGTGQPAAGVITNDPTGTATANDLDYGVLVTAGGLNAIPPSRLFTINFTPCTSGTPTAAEFTCKVDGASDPGGNDVPMTCSVSIP